MGNLLQTASLLTLAFTFIALWIAFVNAPAEDQVVDWPLPWLSPLAATVLLMGMLFLAGLMVRSDRELGAMAATRQPTMKVQLLVAALLLVVAVLALVQALIATLWGGPAWQRWAIVGLVTMTVIAGSGRAVGWALIGGLVWGALGLFVGLGREPTGTVDMLLTGIFVGTTVGAVGGTILTASRRRRGDRR
jgi:hypothetical protein